MTTVSIAMATYNGERFLREQLDSFAAQSRLPDELVISDDCSTDATLAIAEAFANEAPFPVRIERNAANLGYSQNFARALLLCSGEIIFLSDQDDVWFPEKIKSILKTFEADPCAMVVVNDQILTDAELNHDHVTKLANLRSVGKDADGLIEGCCTATRRSWVNALFPMPRECANLERLGYISYDRWINEIAILLGVRRVHYLQYQYFRRTGMNVTSWILSEPTRINYAHLIRYRSSEPPIHAWKSRIEVLRMYDQFLITCAFDARLVDLARRKVSHEIHSLECRVKLARLPMHRKILAVFRLWRFGGYKYFEGSLSAISDVIR